MKTVKGFTIDSASSIDLDDAVWAEPGTNGSIRVQVSIADVSRAVEQSSFLDKQALQKGETAYLPTSRKPLFPLSLEESLSLLPGVQRSVITTEVVVDRYGDVLDVQISERVLVSAAKLSYEEVEAILKKKDTTHPLKAQLELLKEVSQRLAEQRQQRGAAYGKQVGNNYVDEDGRVLTNSPKAQQLIAELMIVTNRVLSEWARNHNLPWLYRTHDYRDLNQLPAARLQFIQSLQAIADEEALRRTLSGWFDKAEYRPEALPHVGLGLDVYAHTTSPIRRYVDLVNQRLLKAALHGETSPCTQSELTAIAAHLTALRLSRQTEKKEYLREKAQSGVAIQIQQQDLAALSPELFNKALRQGFAGQWDVLELILLERIADNTLSPMSYYQVLIGAPNNSETVALKRKVWSTLANSPDSIQILNLTRDNWKPGATVEYWEQATGENWAVLCVVVHDGKEHCPPFWSVARRKVLAQQDSAHCWLEAWINETLVTSEEAKLPGRPPKKTTRQSSPTATAAPVVQTKPVQPELLTDNNGAADYVSSLNQYAQQLKVALPQYNPSATRDNGFFQCTCTFLDYTKEGKGDSKKVAKSLSAQAVWEQVVAQSRAEKNNC